MEMHGRRGSRNTLLAGFYVRGDDQHFGELNTYSGYTPPRNYRVVYPKLNAEFAFVLGIHHPEITGLYT